MAFDIAGARTSGYSDAEIADFLASEAKFDAAAARQSGYSDAEIISHLAATPKQSTVLSELKRGAKQFVSSTQTGLGALTSPEEAAKAGVERAQRISEEAGEGVSFAPVKEAYEKQGILAALGEAASQVPRAVAGMAPAAAATIAGTKAGALAGTAAAPFLGPFAPAGPVVGGLLGAGTALYGSMAGANIERQAQEQAEAGKPISIDRPAAYGAAVGQTALEAVGTGAVLGKRLVKGVLGIADDAALATAQARQALIREAERSALGATARGAVRGTAEIPVEIAQSVLERAQAGLDVMSPEAFNEYGETAYQAGIGGGGLGALTGLPSRGQARAELAQIQPTAAAAARQEAQQRILSARAAPRGFTEEGQGKLFASEELEGLAKPEEEAPVAAAPGVAPTPEAPQPEQLGLGFPTAESPEAAQQELDLLKKQKTPEAQARKEELKGFIRAAEEQAKAEAPKGYTPEGQGRLFTPTEMRESGLKREREPAPEAEAAPLTPGQLKRRGQGAFKFEAPKAEAGITGTTQAAIEPLEPIAPVQPISEAVPEPKLAPKRVVPPELQPVLDKLTAAGVRPEVQTWAENGRNRPFLRKLMSMADMAPEARQDARKALKLEEGSHKAEAFDALFPAPRVPAFEPAAGAGKPSVGVPSEPGPVAPAKPAAPGAGEAVRRGVVPVGRTAPTPTAPEVGAKPALKEPTPTLPRAEQYWNDTAEAVGGKKPFSELTPAQRGAWREAVKEEDVGTLRSEYERIAAEKPVAQPSRAAEVKEARRKATEAEVREQRATKETEEGEELPNAPVDRNELIRRAQSAAQRQQGALKRIAKAFKDGTLDERGRQFDSYTAENAAEELRTVREQLEATKREPNTAEDFVATIAKEAAKGNVDRSLVKFTNWLYANKRNLLEGIKLQVLFRPETEATGTFNGLAKLLRLHKETGGVESPETLAHELTHSAELMMSDAQQLQLINEWRKLMVAQMKRDNNKKAPNKDFWNAVLENLVAPTKDRQEKVLELLPDYSYYQYTSPSEYWAVNGGKILQDAAEGTPLFRFKLFLQQMLASIKSFLGKEANPAVIKMAREVLLNPGERTTKNMLASRYRLSIGKEAAAEIALPSAASPTEGLAEQSELMKEAPGAFKTAMKDVVRIFSEKDDVSYVTRFRTEIADANASVVNRMNILFDGAVRDELTGINNPEALLRQAQDTEALVNPFFRTGAIEKDATTGQYIVTDKAGPGGSIADMLASIKNWSDAKGMDFKLGYAEASKMLEARRLDAMRQENVERKKKKQDLFPIHKLVQKDDRSPAEQIDVALRGLKANPEIQKVADMMDQQRAYMIDKLVAVGRISKETSQEWKDAAGYVPFDRVEDFFDKYVPRRTSGRGITQLGSLPKFVGSTQREVGNVIDNHVKLMGWMLKQTIKQDAASTMLNLLADMGQARRLYGNKTAANNAGNVVRTYKKGQEEYFEVRSHWDAVAFRDAPEPKLTIVKLFAQVSNILRKIVTVMPPFVAKQVTDDIQRAFVQSGVRSPSRLIVPAVTNFLRIAGHEVVFGKDHEFTKDFAKKGLVGNIDYNASNPAETILFNMGYSKRGWLSELHHRLESITRASDLAMRKAIYDRTMAEENKNVGLATARAREFINFRRRGASKTIGLGVATVPFFNAYLQSSDLLLRSMVGRGSSNTEKAVAKRLFWTQAAKMTGFALIYALANSDEEEYQDQTLDERSNNWIIGGKKLPVPGDMAALFKVPVEALVQYMTRRGTEEEQLTNEVVRQVLGYAFEQYVGRVTPVPQAIRPVMEAFTNHSLLTGRPLVGTYQKGLPAEFQTTSSTSELAKAIAKYAFEDLGLELSPVIIDNTVRGYLGGVVPLMNMLVDQMVNPNKTDRPLSKYWFIGQYLTPEVPTGPKEEFYELVNKVMPAKRALKKLEEEDIDAAMKYYEKNADKLKMAELVNTALQNIQQSRAYIKYLESANGAKAIPDSAERLKMKQDVERYENKNLEWVQAAKAQIFGKKE